SAEGVRETLPPPASPPALLQPRMPGGSPRLAALEGPATIPGYSGGQAEAERAKPALPGAPPQPATLRARGSFEDREGHPYEIFFSCSCDRPGCYVEFDRSRRSPLQRFCSQECRRAWERVWEREQRWRETRAGP